MRKIQHTRSKFQRRSKRQNPRPRQLRLNTLDLGSWIFSGSWILDVGSFLRDVGCFTRACLLALLALTTSPFPAVSQTNSTPPANRYLLIVETSRPMQRRSDGMLAAVQQLLNSGIGGQLKRGDTLGIWTYNEDLYPGRFPLQHWSPETHRMVVSRALAFLQQQKFEKQCTFVPVLPALEKLVKDSPFLTVVLVSAGEQKIQGTPFDDQINTLCASWANEQQKARMPLLTILRAKAGKYTDFSVNAAPWPVEMPALPKELLVAQTEKKKAVPPSPKPTPPIGRNIIVSGKKAPAAESNTAASVSTTAPNQISSGQLAQPVTNPPEATLVPSQSPITPIPVPAAETSKGALSPAPLVNPTPPEKSSALPIPEPQRETPSGSGPPITNELVVATKTPDSSSAPSQNPAASPNAPAQQTLVASTTVSVPASPTERDSNKSSVIADSAGNSAFETQKQAPSVRGSSSVSLVTIAPKSFFDRSTILAFAITVAAAVLVLVWIWLRRSRSTRQVSLITRSLDHEKP